MREPILERLQATPLVFDGAMGTMLYTRGVFVNSCYDEICVSRPNLVREIHDTYVAAGADVIESNSFGANRIKLARYGLAARVQEINLSAAKLARAAAGEDVYVAGAMGPCLSPGASWRAGVADELTEVFAEQALALAEGGVDLLMLETFSLLKEAKLAASAAAASGLPVFVSFAFAPNGETALGMRLETVVRELDADPAVAGIGLNCGVGPADAYDLVEQAAALTHKPVVVMPNAGMPKDVDGRLIYMSSPEYFTEYARRFIELGARGVGGCCGTTPDHIRMAAKAVKSMSGVKRHVTIVPAAHNERPDVAMVPSKQKSRFANLLLSGRKVASVELTPPRSTDLTSFLDKARQCHYAGVDAINIPDGPRASARVSPMIAAITLSREVGIEPILHYCCRDRNLIGMQSDLLGGYAAGLRNVLAITGDPPKLGDYPDATGVFDVDAIGLTQLATNLNRGMDLGGNPIDPPAGIFVGVGANPCAVEPERELERFIAKAAAGAEFAITQPVFDPEALFRFLDQIEAADRRLPIVAGVWPLVSYKNAEFMRNEVPGVVVPDEVLERMGRCKTKEDGVAMGVEISREICERIAQRVDGFQVSAPFGRVQIALDVLA
ncbi:MAG: bifunctional homocysteine S-methyltransferase/methylenetetrahydrofolate reductase [Victivallales bacterium]|nr:bifunctional homocysteine S-methyltransferase/methylenetetrahydrofolate reductase [Victivallales bacterium]